MLGFWLAIRISRAVVKQMLWRLRNRLIVAYFFIAVVPIILITLLAGLGVALVGGQISIFLVTSELERRTVSLRASIDLLARDTHGETWMENIARFLQARYPGLQLVIQDNRRLAFPDDAASAPIGLARKVTALPSRTATLRLGSCNISRIAPFSRCFLLRATSWAAGARYWRKRRS